MAESDISKGNRIRDSRWLSSFRQAAEKCGLLEPSQSVVAGVSGGADSMVLLESLTGCGFRPLVAHVNYHMRGTDSDADEKLVRETSDRLGCECEVLDCYLEEEAARRKTSKQDLAREVRYRFFQNLAVQAGARFVAVGHHKDDQIETILLNLFRGAGARGLSALKPVRSLTRDGDIDLVRPLLSFSRREIEAHAAHEGIVWRVDQSNLTSAYQRGVVCNAIIPLIEKHFGRKGLDEIGRLSETMSDLENVERRFSSTLIKKVKVGYEVAIEDLKELPQSLQGRVVLDALKAVSEEAPVSRDVSERILSLLTSQVGRFITFGIVCVTRDRSVLLFKEGDREGDRYEEGLLEIPGQLWFLGMQFAAEIVQALPAVSEIGRYEIYIDLSVVKAPLLVRTWKTGDTIKPIGLGGTKLISDVLTDARVSATSRKQVPVVIADRTIVWVAGICRSDLGLVDHTSSEIARIVVVQDDSDKKSSQTLV